MALTTHEQIRVESGFQSRFVREEFINSTGVSTNTFFVNSDDNVKFVPEFGTGNTIAGVSDVQVWCGLAGVYGTSRLNVVAVDIDQGSVRLDVVPTVGSSLTINYSSSAITSKDIENVRLQAEATVNQRLSLCYDLPLSANSSLATSLATRLAMALLLIRNYGAGAKDTSSDGYAMYDKLMGGNIAVINRGDGSDSDTANVGEIGLICTPNFQLVDDNGQVIPRNDHSVDGEQNYTAGGRVNGVIFDITEENFRRKPWQKDVDKDQPGSGLLE